jgi:Uma2 family endonuclease
VEPRPYTVAEVYAWPNDGNRYEVVHGELLVTPPGDIMWGDDVWVVPDLFVVVPEQVSRTWKTFQNLRLVIEVLSPASARGDRVVKRAAYQENGVETYWVVDADKRFVEVWHPGDEAAEIAVEELRWRVTPDAPELVIQLPALFGRMPR